MSDQTSNPMATASVSPSSGATAGTTTAGASAASRRGRCRIDTLSHCRRQLAATYRQLAAWDPPDLKPMERIARARCLGFLLSEAAAAMRSDQIEQRIAHLEEIARSGQH